MKKCVLLLIRPKLNISGSVGYLLLFFQGKYDQYYGLWKLESGQQSSLKLEVEGCEIHAQVQCAPHKFRPLNIIIASSTEVAAS
jgi:hypothetical protein